MVLKDSVGGQEGMPRLFTRPDRLRVGGQAESASRARLTLGRAGRRGSVCGKRGAYTGKEAEIRIEKFYVLRRRKTHGPDVAGPDSGSGSSSGSRSRQLLRRADTPNLLPPPADQANGQDERVRGAGRGGARGLRAGAARRPAPPFRRCCRRACHSAEGRGLLSLLLPPRLPLPVGRVCHCHWDPPCHYPSRAR